MLMRIAAIVLASFLFIAGCTVNSVTKADIEGVKAGSKITYRYEKEGKSWFYADKVTRVEGDTVYYNPSKMESDSGKDTRIDDFDTTRELSIKLPELLKFENEQGPEEKKIIWIQ